MKQNTHFNRFDLLTTLIILSVPYLALSLNQHGFLALLPFIREEFVLNRTQVGLYSTFYFLSSALLAITTGIIVDSLGARKGVLLGIGFMGSIIFLYSLAPSYGVLLLLAFLAGLGWSIITPSVNKGVILAAPIEKRAVSMGIMQSGMGIGGLTGAILLPLLGESFGWRMAIQVSAVFALMMWFLVFLFYKEKSKDYRINDIKDEQCNKRSIKNNFGYVLKSKPLLKACMLGLIFGISTGSILSHYTVFLSEDLLLSRTAAGVGLGAFQVGGILGRPVWGLVSDKLFKQDRSKTLYVMGIIIGAMYLFFGVFISNFSINYVSILVISFCLGASAFGWTGVHFVAIGEFAGDQLVGIATGLSLLFVRTGMLIAPPIFGFIADLRGDYMLSWIFFGLVVSCASIVYHFSAISKKVD